jgi:inorganic pyrophosphatase
MKSNIITILVLFFMGLNSATCFSEEIAENLTKKNLYTIVGENNFLTEYPSKNNDGSVNAVIEIPTGTIEKWEVNKKDGSLKWEFEKGKPRVVKYLGYPGNYGMIPRTILPKELGGDGDPLDVIVLGPAVPRGSVVRAKLIGVLKLLDGGEQDDKLIAVLENTPMYEINSIQEMNSKFIGVSKIIETWFVNYKGPGELSSKGFAERNEAQKILEYAIKSYENKN